MNTRNAVLALVVLGFTIIVVRSSSYKYRWNWPLSFDGYDFSVGDDAIETNSPESLIRQYDARIEAMREKLVQTERRFAQQMEGAMRSLEEFYSAKLKAVEEELLRTRRSRSGSYSVTNTVLENVLRNNNGKRWVYLCDWIRCASGSEYDSAMWLVRRYLQSRGALSATSSTSSSSNSNNNVKTSTSSSSSSSSTTKIIIRIVHLIGRCDSQMHRATRDVASAALAAATRQNSTSVFSPGVSIRLRHVKLRDFDFRNCSSSSSSSSIGRPKKSRTSREEPSHSSSLHDDEIEQIEETGEETEIPITGGARNGEQRKIGNNKKRGDENAEMEESRGGGGADETEEFVDEDANALTPPPGADTRWIDILAVDAPPRGELSKPVIFTLLSKWMGRVKTNGLVMGSGYVADYALESSSPAVLSFSKSSSSGSSSSSPSLANVVSGWRRDAAVKAEVDRYRLSDENELGQEESIYVAGGNMYYFYRIKPKILG